MTLSTASIGKPTNPLSQLSPQAKRSRSPSMPTNGLRQCTNVHKPKATRSTADVLLAGISRRQSTTCSNARVTNAWQPEPKPSKNSANTYHDITHQHWWRTWSSPALKTGTTKMTYNNPPTNWWRWPQCNLALTNQWSLSQPMHNQMGPLPPWTHSQDLEMSNHPLLLRTKTGSPFQPTLWARKTTDQVWTTFRTIWLCRNGELYGKNYKEQWTIALHTTRESVRRIYHQSKDQVSEEDSNTLHAQPIEEVMKWMKRHLDAYLATAEVYLEQNVDPG
jgi:hypothetical protein